MLTLYLKLKAKNVCVVFIFKETINYQKNKDE